jgi:hypothetical protein
MELMTYRNYLTSRYNLLSDKIPPDKNFCGEFFSLLRQRNAPSAANGGGRLAKQNIDPPHTVTFGLLHGKLRSQPQHDMCTQTGDLIGY